MSLTQNLIYEYNLNGYRIDYQSYFDNNYALLLKDGKGVLLNSSVLSGKPTTTNGFISNWINGKTLYQVIIDTQDDDNDYDTTDYIIVSSKFEDGNVSYDFSVDGNFELISGVTYELPDGVLTITENNDVETFTVTSVDETKITTTRTTNWGEPDETVYQFFNKEDAQSYLDSLTTASN